MHLEEALIFFPSFGEETGTLQRFTQHSAFSVFISYQHSLKMVTSSWYSGVSDGAAAAEGHSLDPPILHVAFGRLLRSP